jgi:beta-lactamase superfamily II metal-dependent hydrolase
MRSPFSLCHTTLQRLLLALTFLMGWGPQNCLAEFQPSGLLEIHYINVGQGGCTLIIGPDGTRILYDFGAVSGERDIVPYLREVAGIAPTDGLHFTMVSHRDKDHYNGYKGVVEAGYQVLVANFGSGSPKRPSSTMTKNWLKPAEDTIAGPVLPIPVGLRIPLGDGSEALVVAANGKIWGWKNPLSNKD